jgi:hypothetical protein
MKRALAILAALLLSLPAAAQQVVSPLPLGSASAQTQGALLNSGDLIVFQISGVTWATVKVVVPSVVGSTGPVFEVSNDGGVSYAYCCYMKRLDTGAPNNALTAPATALGITSSTWESPLPANATHVRIRATVNGTQSGTFTIQGQQVYAPGAPVVAVLTNAVTAVGTLGPYDLSGWSGAVLVAVTPATSTVTWQPVDDAGASLGGAVGIPASSTTFLQGSRSGSSPSQAGTLAANTNGYIPMTRRAAVVVGTLAATTLRLEVNR